MVLILEKSSINYGPIDSKLESELNPVENNVLRSEWKAQITESVSIAWFSSLDVMQLLRSENKVKSEYIKRRPACIINEAHEWTFQELL